MIYVLPNILPDTLVEKIRQLAADAEFVDGMRTAGIGVAHFREATYPEPLVFRPERFLERTFSPFEFLPFGGGARRCLGAALAGYEMRLVVATLIRGFVLRLRSLRPDLGKVRAANAGPRHGVEVEVVERT